MIVDNFTCGDDPNNDNDSDDDLSTDEDSDPNTDNDDTDETNEISMDVMAKHKRLSILLYMKARNMKV